MGIAIIILGLFIVLLVVVIYKLGRKLEAKDANIDAIKSRIETTKDRTTNGLLFLTLNELLEFINNQK